VITASLEGSLALVAEIRVLDHLVVGGGELISLPNADFL